MKDNNIIPNRNLVVRKLDLPETWNPMFLQILYKVSMDSPYQRHKGIGHFRVYSEIREMPNFLFLGLTLFADK
ncbi:hypothetical protein Ahy_B02g058470 isoform B [Arachis hypogaea]|uniref:Uncharacterized protein n=1 Tax=Arachis hypogaea TaxID=3818 RepID=A0A445AEP7_ARAHY|nr:hypothetical protein Ahy_B02g058470 isoform B [Arachis hypogaea]